jgi:hypothetical protein
MVLGQIAHIVEVGGLVVEALEAMRDRLAEGCGAEEEGAQEDRGQQQRGKGHPGRTRVHVMASDDP